MLTYSINQLYKREKRLAKKYYDRLYKEYCVADLSKYKENKVNSPHHNRINKCQIKIKC